MHAKASFRRGRRLAAIGLSCACLALPVAGLAVTPLSPRLANATRVSLFAQLAARGLPEVGHNSVAIAITSALGMRPSATTKRYDEPYAHLPKVSVATTTASESCAGVTAVVTSVSVPPFKPFRVRGTYCLVGAGEWASQDQRVEPLGE